jgi:pilus assembly protein CpaD
MISAPSGTASEVAGLQVVAEVREMIKEAGFSPAIVGVEAAPGSHNVKLSYLRVVAKGPECGLWPTNLASDPANLPYPNLGCATQQNFAAMIANPADLIGPRGETPRIGDRREQIWKKYKEGQSTGAKKSEDEKVRTDQ